MSRLLVPEWRCLKVVGGGWWGRGVGWTRSQRRQWRSWNTNIWPKCSCSISYKNGSSQLGSCRASVLRSKGQGSISSGMMVMMMSSLPRLTTVRSVSSRLMAALTSLAELTGSPLMLMMTSLSRRPALLRQNQRGEEKAKEMSNFVVIEKKKKNQLIPMRRWHSLATFWIIWSSDMKQNFRLYQSSSKISDLNASRKTVNSAPVLLLYSNRWRWFKLATAGRRIYSVASWY